MEDPAMEIATEALRRMLEKRSDLEVTVIQSKRLDLAITHQRRVLARLRGVKMPKPRYDSTQGKLLKLLEDNERGLPIETAARTTGLSYDNAASSLSKLVLMGWVERVRDGFYRAA